MGRRGEEGTLRKLKLFRGFWAILSKEFIVMLRDPMTLFFMLFPPLIQMIAFGYALVVALNATMYVMPYFFPWQGIVVAVVAGFGFALLAAILPARTAAKLDIVAALHYE